MIRYFLDGLPIEPPLNVDSLSLTKTRHRQYWGFFHQNMGLVGGLGNLLFTDPVAVKSLTKGFRSLETNTVFSVSGEGLDYRARIDYSSYSQSGEGVSVNLLSGDVADTIAARIDTKYSIYLDEARTLPGRPIGDPDTCAIDRYKARTMPRSGLSGLPCLGSADPSLPTVIYKNATTDAVRVAVSGQLLLRVTLGSVSRYIVRLNGVDAVDLSPATTSIAALIDQTISLAAGESLTVSVLTTGGASELYYDELSLSVQVLPDATSSRVYCITPLRALRLVLNQMGIADVGIATDVLTASNYLSTAAALSGDSSATMQLSLGDILSNLTTLYYLKTGLDRSAGAGAGNLTLTARSNSPAPTLIRREQISSLTIRRAADFAFGSVTAGYASPSDTAQQLGNGYRLQTWATDARLSQNALNLQPTWVVDPGRIEQARRGLLSANADKNTDVYYVSGDSLAAADLYNRWKPHYANVLPELHTLACISDYATYAGLSDTLTYTGPDGVTLTGEVLDAAYAHTDHLLTVNLLIR